MTRQEKDIDAGSRMHVLDWLDSEDFLPRLGDVVAPIGFSVAANASFQPKGRRDARESVLIGVEEPFLSKDEKRKLVDWWLVHKQGAKLPTWDFVAQAVAKDGRPALILVEAKAHKSELVNGGKERGKRARPGDQGRTDENHERIGLAIEEARRALASAVPGIAISRDASYQFSNRIAYAWKLASMGIPIALVYLGFTGDAMIGEDYFAYSEDWQAVFRNHATGHFPSSHFEREISCGAASFWLFPRSLAVKRMSPAISERRAVQ